jgi:hypothetical protein
MYEETVHIPLIVKPAADRPESAKECRSVAGPGNKRSPARVGSFATTCDIHATIVDLATSNGTGKPGDTPAHASAHDAAGGSRRPAGAGVDAATGTRSKDPRHTYRTMQKDGRSFAWALSARRPEGQPAGWPVDVVTEGTGVGQTAYSQRMIRHGSLKYVWNCGGPDELYDLSTDRYEMKNLIDDPEVTGTVEDLQSRLGDWMDLHQDSIRAQYRRSIRE